MDLQLIQMQAEIDREVAIRYHIKINFKNLQTDHTTGPRLDLELANCNSDM